MSRTRSTIKRSTVILDDTMVRDYKLALEKLSSEQSKGFATRSDSSHSLNSEISMDSILSRDTSILDLIINDQPQEDNAVEILCLTHSALAKDQDLDWDSWDTDPVAASRTALEF